jgi:hypothetical protein
MNSLHEHQPFGCRTQKRLGCSTSGLKKRASLKRRLLGAFRTRTSVIAQAGPVAFGQTVTLAATVKNMSAVIGVPDGEVTFFDGATVLGTGQLRGGKASIKFSDLPIGRDSIRVVYGGSAFAPSTSSNLIMNVRAGDTETRARAARH